MSRAGRYEQGRDGWDGEMTSGLLVKEGQALPLFWRYHLMAQPEAASASPMDPLCTASSGPRKKRPRQVGASMASPPHDIKFQNLVLFILEKKMGTTRRNFLMELARRKGFRVENELR